MKQRPILMSGPLVIEILSGNKTQTRRPVKALREMNPDSINLLSNEMWYETFEFDRKENGHVFHILSKYGNPGDQLWVRETFFKYSDYDSNPDEFFKENPYLYRADFNEEDEQSFRDRDLKWKPSIFMPKKASRITVEIEEIRIERLEEISEEDAKAEGVESVHVHGGKGPSFDSFRVGFYNKWIEIYGVQSYTLNPWVWVIQFKKIDQ